jgi:DNA polymerase III epsilon subunit-like protein
MEDLLLEAARDLDLVALDFETTGSVPGWPNEPWQVGLVRLRQGRVSADERFTTLIRVAPDRPFHPSTPGDHHRLRREIAAAPAWDSLRPLLLDWCGGRPLIAHNVATERGLLRRLAPLTPWGPWIDTLRLVRAAFPGLADYALGAVVRSLGLAGRLAEVAPAWQAHDALSDALAAAVVLEHLLASPGWQEAKLAQLSRPPPVPRIRR